MGGTYKGSDEVGNHEADETDSARSGDGQCDGCRYRDQQQDAGSGRLNAHRLGGAVTAGQGIEDRTAQHHQHREQQRREHDDGYRIPASPGQRPQGPEHDRAGGLWRVRGEDDEIGQGLEAKPDAQSSEDQLQRRLGASRDGQDQQSSQQCPRESHHPNGHGTRSTDDDDGESGTGGCTCTDPQHVGLGQGVTDHSLQHHT